MAAWSEDICGCEERAVEEEGGGAHWGCLDSLSVPGVDMFEEGLAASGSQRVNDEQMWETDGYRGRASVPLRPWLTVQAC